MLENKKQLRQAVFEELKSASTGQRTLSLHDIRAKVIDRIPGAADMEGHRWPLVRELIDDQIASIYRQSMRRFTDAEGEDNGGTQQLVIVGYEYVRAGYSMDRDGGPTFVPTALCTNEELAARAKQYRKASTAGASHADELEKIVKLRVEAMANGQVLKLEVRVESRVAPPDPQSSLFEAA